MATRCGSRRGSAHSAIWPPTGQQIPVFKSWGTPDVDPAACAHTFFSHSHRILAPTTTFMTKRREIQTRQGRDDLWFAGGWTNWFDSQEAALDSATDIAAQVGGGVTAVGREDPGVFADGDNQRRAIEQWFTRVAAHAPQELRERLAACLRDVECAG